MWAHANRRSRRATSTPCSSPARVTAAPARTPAPGSRAPTPSSTATSPRRRRAWPRSSASSRSPAACPSHCAPETPGSFHEGGELGYSLLHACGAALDDPDLVVFCVVGDGEAETGAAGHELARGRSSSTRRATARCCRSCTSTSTRSPTRRCWPASPRTTCSRCCAATATSRTSSRATIPAPVHQAMAAALDACLDAIADIQRPRPARASGPTPGWRWPMIVLRTPKGWTCPPVVDGQPVEGTFRAHQVPLPERPAGRRRTARVLEQWLQLVPARGAVRRRRPPGAELLGAGRRSGERRMSANPVANGGEPPARPPTAGLARLRGRRRRARRERARGDARARRAGCATSRRRNPDNFLHVRPRRAGQQPAAGHPRRHRPQLAGPRSAEHDERLAPRRAGHRDPLRAHLPGPARGLPAHRSARRVHLLRGVHPHRRLDVQPARQVARGEQRGAVAAADRRASTTCCPRTCGARTTTAAPTRTPASSTS